MGTLQGPWGHCRGRGDIERTGGRGVESVLTPAQVSDVLWYWDASTGSSTPVLAHSSLWVQGRSWLRNGH